MSDQRDTEDKVKEGVEHLQNAALELIAAARVFLDIAEEVVRDPGPLVARATQHGAPRSDPDETVQRIRVV